MLSMLAKLLKALNSEAQPGQIALAMALALVVALTPTFSLHNVLIVLLAFVLRTNLSAFFVAFAGFSAIAWFADPYLAGLGEQLLTHAALQETWTALYQNDFWRMTAFNHTLVLGGLVVGVLAFVPVLLLSRWLVVQYRERLLAWVNRLRIAQLLKGTKFYRIYQSLAE